MTDLDRLRIFQAVAQTGSFTRAAAVLHLTQPGISKHIRQMEEYFGVSLFDRLGRSVALTQAGEILFEATQEIMALMGAAEQRIADLSGMRRGKLSLGASFPIGVYILPGILATYRSRFPQVEVKLEISTSAKIEARVLENKLDIGLVSHDVDHPKLVSREFMSDDLVVIVPRNHPWSRKSRIKPEQLLGQTFILSAKGAGTRAVVEERLKAKGIVLQDVLDFANPEGVKHAVQQGLGVSVQSRSTVQQELSAGSLHALRLADMAPRIAYLYIYRKHRHLPSAAQAFLALLSPQRASAKTK